VTTTEAEATETTASIGTSGDTTAGTGGDTTTGTTGEPAGPTLLVCSFVADSVTRFDLATGEFLGALGPSEDLDGALGVTVGPDGQIYVASEESNMVLRYDGASGAFIDRFVWDDPGTPDDETGGLSGPGAVLFGADGMLYVSSFDSDAILRYDGATGAFESVFVPEGSGGLDGPDAGMTFGPDGDLFVPGFYSNTVSRFDGATGAPLPDFTPTRC
jgi:streptogramin lyase